MDSPWWCKDNDLCYYDKNTNSIIDINKYFRESLSRFNSPTIEQQGCIDCFRESKSINPFIRQSIHKKDLTALSFHNTSFTGSNSFQFQMECKDGCDLQSIEDIFCTSRGFDGQQNYWICESQDIKITYKLSNYNVTCEGFDNSTDVNVVVGSCFITYEIKEKIKNLDGFMFGCMFLFICIQCMVIHHFSFVKFLILVNIICFCMMIAWLRFMLYSM